MSLMPSRSRNRRGGSIVLTASLARKRKAASRLGSYLDNRSRTSSKCCYARSGRSTATYPELISGPSWKSSVHGTAVKRRRRPRLYSARGGPDLLHPGKARSIHSLLRYAIDQLRWRLVPLQYRFDGRSPDFWKRTGDRCYSFASLGPDRNVGSPRFPDCLDHRDREGVYKCALGHSFRGPDRSQADGRSSSLTGGTSFCSSVTPR